MADGTRLASTLAVLAVGIAACGGGPTELVAGDPTAGASVYAANCAACHGADLRGVEQVGPSLLDELFAPSSHPDEAFRLAVTEGVDAHHGAPGPMPAIGGLTDQDVADVIAHVRAEQRAAGFE